MDTTSHTYPEPVETLWRGEPRFHCPICSRDSDSRSTIVSHIHEMHRPGPTPHTLAGISGAPPNTSIQLEMPLTPEGANLLKGIQEEALAKSKVDHQDGPSGAKKVSASGSTPKNSKFPGASLD